MPKRVCLLELFHLVGMKTGLSLPVHRWAILPDLDSASDTLLW
jgi:hypothetical protein